MKENESHAGQYPKKRYADGYAEVLRKQGLTVEVREKTVYDVIVIRNPP